MNPYFIAFAPKVWKPELPEQTRLVLEKIAPSQVYEFEDLMPRILASPYVSVDFETESKDPEIKKGALDMRFLQSVGASLAWREESGVHTAYLPFRHALYKFNWPNPKEVLAPIMANPNIIKIFHNLKFDYGVGKTEGVTSVWPFVDTMVMSWIYDENIPPQLKALMKLYLDWPALKFDFTTQLGVYPPEVLCPYACQDAYGTLLLYEFFMENFTLAQKKLYHNLEAKITRILVEAEWRGITVDKSLLDDYKLKFQYQKQKLKTRIEENLGVKSLGQKDISAVKLLNILRDKEVPLKSTNAKTLDSWMSVYAHTVEPEVRTALEDLKPFRYMAKMEGTFTKQVEAALWPDGCIRPAAHQWSYEDKGNKTRGTISGRFSYTKPSINTFVKASRDEDLAAFMKANLPDVSFRRLLTVPSDDYVMICGDLSQIELRIMAAVANDEVMLEILNNGGDPYAEAAAAIFNKPVEEIVEGNARYEAGDATALVYYLMRQVGKTVVLAQSYGAGAAKLAAVGWKPLMRFLFDGKPPSMDEAKRGAESFMRGAINAFTKKFKGFGSFHKRVEGVLRDHRVVTSWFGRSRRFPTFVVGDHKMVLQGANFLPQSNAVDLCKLAMIYFYEKAAEMGLDAWIVANIHDEIIIISHRKDANAAADLLAEAFGAQEKIPRPFVKLDFKISVGRNWYDQKRYRTGDDIGELLSDPKKQPKGPELIQELTELFEKIKPCQQCPVFEDYGWEKVFASGHISDGVDLVIVGANPSKDDVKQGRPLMGKAGKELREVANAIGLPLDTKTMLLPGMFCHSPDTQGILTTHISNCRPFLDEILNAVQPKIVLCLGSIAQRAVVGGNAASLQKGWRETTRPFKVFVTSHPGWIVGSPSEKLEWIEELKEVVKELDNLVS